MRNKKTPVEELVKELANGRRRPFTAFGKEWQGDIFYSDIHSALQCTYGKHYPAGLHKQACDGLRAEGFYIHS